MRVPTVVLVTAEFVLQCFNFPRNSVRLWPIVSGHVGGAESRESHRKECLQSVLCEADIDEHWAQEIPHLLECSGVMKLNDASGYLSFYGVTLAPFYGRH